MSRSGIFPLIAIVCIVNGMLSPWLAITFQIVPLLMPEVFPRTVGWALFFSSIFMATATMFGSGVFAALYERLIDDRPESTVSMWIWLTGAILMSLPALESVNKML